MLNFKCGAKLHESLNGQNNRKRRRVYLCEQGDRKRRHAPSNGQKDRKCRRPEILAHERVNSMLRTIKALEDQISCLKSLFQQAYASLRETSTKHTCRALFCEKLFTNLKYLYKHIREQKNSAHEPLAILINETHCFVCSKTCFKSFDFVKHEKMYHGETYVSRLNKFLDTSISLSPLSSRSTIINDPSSR